MFGQLSVQGSVITEQAQGWEAGGKLLNITIKEPQEGNVRPETAAHTGWFDFS